MLQMLHLQHVANDAHTPHVGLETYGFVANDLWWYKLGGTKENPDGCFRIQSLGQTKVNDLDLVASARMAHYVLRLQIEMHHTLAVHVGHAIANLSQEQDAVHFGQGEVVSHHTFEQFSASDAREFENWSVVIL